MQNSTLPDPGRENKEVINSQKAIINERSYLKDLYNAVADIVLILNEKRQIVFYNENLVKVLGLEDDFSLYGLRPGEALNCAHAFETESGCGTTEFCKTCGMVQAAIKSSKGYQDTKECKITQLKTGDALDLLVKATPVVFDSKKFTIFSIKDISDEKRRKVLERIFFHDILNTAGGVKAISELLIDATDEELELFRKMLNKSSEKLLDEICSQRDLTAAENNELAVNLSLIESKEFLAGMKDLYLMHEVAEGKNLDVDESSENITFQIDQTLLSRIVGNLIKNALEACNEGDTVTFGNLREGEKITFWVHNPSFIPRDIQLQLFKRSFSTKGTNRGIGTYSIKLLTEKYLKGIVSFTSVEESGTIFKVTFPIMQ